MKKPHGQGFGIEFRRGDPLAQKMVVLGALAALAWVALAVLARFGALARLGWPFGNDEWEKALSRAGAVIPRGPGAWNQHRDGALGADLPILKIIAIAPRAILKVDILEIAFIAATLVALRIEIAVFINGDEEIKGEVLAMVAAVILGGAMDAAMVKRLKSDFFIARIEFFRGAFPIARVEFFRSVSPIVRAEIIERSLAVIMGAVGRRVLAAIMGGACGSVLAADMVEALGLLAASAKLRRGFGVVVAQFEKPVFPGANFC